MSSIAQEETESAVLLPPPPREQLWEFLRRRRRSFRRLTGLVRWLSVQGLGVFISFVVVFVLNGFVNEWQVAYDVLVQIRSPLTDPAVGVHWLALLLALEGYLVVPSVVGALVGYSVTEDSRQKAAPNTETDVSRVRSGRYIPRLERLLYQGHGHAVPAHFVRRFVEIHHAAWARAQRHWEQVVAEYLNNDPVPLDAPPKVAMHRAVSAAANVLWTAAEQDNRCPICEARSRVSNGSDNR